MTGLVRFRMLWKRADTRMKRGLELFFQFTSVD
jgi:hypothetical protein